MDRKLIFDAVRRLLGRGFRQAEVVELDAAIDSAMRPDSPDPLESPRAVSDAGVALIKRFEGCARRREDGLVEAYPDPGSGGEPWTIGWGATGPGIGPGTTWTPAQCDARLTVDLERYAGEVAQAIGDTPTTQAQFDALVSFHYNTGAIGRATLTRKHRAGDHAGAAREFARWNRAGGRLMAGLARRRAAEAALYRASYPLDFNIHWELRVPRPRWPNQGVPIMRCISAAVAAIALVAGAANAQGQGQGKGNDRGGGKPAAATQQGGGNGGGGGQGNGGAERGNQGQGGGASMAQSMRGSDNRGGGGKAAREERGNSGNAQRGERGNDRPAARGNDRAVERANAGNRGISGNRGNDIRPVVVDNRGRDNDRGADIVRVRDFARLAPRGLIEGCPPGLAKKNPPCVPPGQVRNQTRSLFGWDRPDFWGVSGLDGGRYFYDDGYLMRLGPDGRIGGYVPLLGGALGIGNAWPSYYEPFALPGYYEQYYGLGPYDSYRYADDVIYRVDPQTAAITSVAALLTGDDFVIGQPMPLGYDVYNVPYGYRDRYMDGPDGYYRYADGYVYQVDPETQLIAAAIELLT